MTKPKLDAGASTSTARKIETAKMVTVGLKSPNGLILRLFNEQAVSENTPAGPRNFKQSFPNQKAGTVELKGYGGAAFGERQSHRIVGQYALTNNVDAEFMRKWLEQNQEHDLVINNLIFIAADEASAADQGKDQLKVWDGLHPLRMANPKVKDPRVPKKVRTMTKKDDDDGDTLSAPVAA